VRRARGLTDLPLGVGFGVSRPEQAEWIAGFADAVIVGSALARLVEDGDAFGAPGRVATLVASLRAAMRAAVAARAG
jgi:tryptophan synthase alpha chain